MNITSITSDNFVGIFEKGKYLISEAMPTCDLTAFQKEWQNTLKQERGVIFTAEIDDKIIGILMGVIDFNSCNRQRTLTECHWYVLKEHRQTAGVKLYQSFVDFAKKDFCSALIFNCPTENKILEQFYLKNGFKEIGKLFKQEL